MYPLLRRLALPILLLFAIAGCEPSPPPGMGIGHQAPEIEGQDVDGKAIRLSEFKGKVVLVDFWATWCGYCKELIPAEKELMNLYKGRRFTILGISADRHADDLRNYLGTAQLPWPNIYDRKGTISQAWGADALPAFVLIDDEGVIRGRWRSGRDFGEIATMTSKLVRTVEAK